MAAQLNLLVVRRWTLDAARIRTSVRAVGLSVRLVNVDFAASLAAALSRDTFDAVIYDPETPGLGEDTLLSIMREQKVMLPVITLRDGDDIGAAVARELLALRN